MHHVCKYGGGRPGKSGHVQLDQCRYLLFLNGTLYLQVSHLHLQLLLLMSLLIGMNSLCLFIYFVLCTFLLSLHLAKPLN